MYSSNRTVQAQKFSTLRRLAHNVIVVRVTVVVAWISMVGGMLSLLALILDGLVSR